MKNNYKGTIIISITALVISFLAIVISTIAFWSSCKLEYDSGNAILSTFSIIVTILIGAVTVLIAWQVYNHYVAKDEVNKMMEKEMKQLAEDVWNILDSITSSVNVISFSQGNHKDFDAYMLGIEAAKKCKTISLKDQAINDIIERFHHLYLECTEREEMKIIRGK
jgi:heme/copper-type cytochrome/quinol oxidase subunit 2